MLHSIGIMTNITKATVTNLICMMVEGETHTMKKTIDITNSIKVVTLNNSIKNILNTPKISRNSTMARINRGRSVTTQITKITTKNTVIWLKMIKVLRKYIKASASLYFQWIGTLIVWRAMKPIMTHKMRKKINNFNLNLTNMETWWAHMASKNLLFICKIGEMAFWNNIFTPPKNLKKWRCNSSRKKWVWSHGSATFKKWKDTS